MTDLDRAKTLRERRRLDDVAPRIKPVDEQPAGATAEPEGEPERRVRLTKAQQLALVKILAVHDDLSVARELFADESSEAAAEISDRTLRRWRQRIELGEFSAEVSAARAEIARVTLASRPGRVEGLRTEYRRLGRLVNRVTDANLLLAISRERVKVLAELRAETAGWQPAGASAGAISDDDEPIDVDELFEALGLFKQQQIDMATALAGAQRPAPEELSE